MAYDELRPAPETAAGIFVARVRGVSSSADPHDTGSY
jgi:hypothetical protein